MFVGSNCFANLCPSIRPLDMIPVSEVQIQFNVSVALKLCFFCYHGSSSQSTSARRKTSHASVQLLFGMVAKKSSYEESYYLALFVRSLKIEVTE